MEVGCKQAESTNNSCNMSTISKHLRLDAVMQKAHQDRLGENKHTRTAHVR